MAERGVAAADAEYSATVGLDLHRQDRGSRDGGVARQWLGDAGAETDAFRRNRGECQRLVDVAVVVLAVGEEQPVPAGVLVHPGNAPGAAGSGEVRHPEFGLHACAV